MSQVTPEEAERVFNQVHTDNKVLEGYVPAQFAAQLALSAMKAAYNHFNSRTANVTIHHDAMEKAESYRKVLEREVNRAH